MANLTPKQLNTLYRLRGSARRNLMSSIIKEKAKTAIMPFLRNTNQMASEEETLDVLSAARRIFLILAHDPRSYSLIFFRINLN